MKVFPQTKIVLLLSLVLSLTTSFRIESNENVTNEEVSPEWDTEKYQHARIGAKVCMDELGCFEITRDFFHPFHRPLNFLPHDRATIDTQFFLFTKFHPKESHDLSVHDPEGIEESPLNPEHRTVFIVHGFFDSRFYGKWMEEVKDNILLQNDYNVIIVDWSKGNGAPYTQATANSRVVGAEIALLIETLQKLRGLSPVNCHIIGHSLGAHIAGYAGERLNKLGRISGLDPAQPYFQNMPPRVRLDQTDADFVDVIHTDSSSYKFLPLGMSQAVGHVDFYPNNGMSQPGCSHAAIQSIFVEGLIDAARRIVSCNHQRAVDFFLYSINYKRALPVAYECRKWADYEDGRCAECGKDNKRCAVMGFQADQFKPHKNDSKSVKMYLGTSSNAPFWEHAYQINMKLRKPKTSFEDRKGSIKLILQGTKTSQEVKLTTKTGNLIHGASYPFLVRQQDLLGDIRSVTFSWESSSWSFFSTHTIHLDYVKVVPMNVNDYGMQKLQTKIFCEISGEAVKSKTVVHLQECK